MVEAHDKVKELRDQCKKVDDKFSSQLILCECILYLQSRLCLSHFCMFSLYLILSPDELFVTLVYDRYALYQEAMFFVKLVAAASYEISCNSYKAKEAAQKRDLRALSGFERRLVANHLSQDYVQPLSGSHRSLSFDENQINVQPMKKAVESMNSMISVIEAFGTKFEEASNFIETGAEALRVIIDSISPFVEVASLINPFVEFGNEVLDALSFLECPKEQLGVFSFICDLDAIIADTVEGIVNSLLEVLGVPTLDDLFEWLEGLILDAINFDFSIDFLPSLGIFDDISVSMSELLFEPMKVQLAPFIDAMAENPFGSAFDESGQADVTIPGAFPSTSHRESTPVARICFKTNLSLLNLSPSSQLSATSNTV